MHPAFHDLPPDSDPNIIARAHQEVTAWARDRTHEEVIAKLIEVRAGQLRALRDLKAAVARVRELEAEQEKLRRGGRGHRREDTERMAAVRQLAEEVMTQWLRDRWQRGLMLWSEITREDRAELYQRIRSEIGARVLGVYPDDRTVSAWLQHVFETANRADWGMPGELNGS